MDLRSAWRVFFNHPSIALFTITLLALGMGGMVTVCSPIYSLVFAPLPYPQPDQLVRIGGDIQLFNIFTSNFEKEEILNRIFPKMMAYLPSDSKVKMRATDTGKYREVHSVLVTDEFFETLGVQPMIGSGFRRKENRDGVVISYRFWRDEMMRVDNPVGVNVLIDERPFRVVGVMPEKFRFPIDADVWQGFNEKWWPIHRGTQFVGRMRDGASLNQAAKDIKSIDFTNLMNTISSSGPLLQPLQIFLYSDNRSLLWMFGTASAMFLVLMCAGVVNLLIMQGTHRKSEIAIRMILGASRKRVVCQLLIETLPLIIVSGVLAWGIYELADVWMRKQFLVLQDVKVDISAIMAFSAALVMIATLIGGLVPALYTTNINLSTYLKTAAGDKRRFFSSQELLLGIQLGMSLALLVCVIILLRSMMFRVDYPIGWSSEKIAIVSTELQNIDNSRRSKDTLLRYARFTEDANRELKAIPGVMSIGTLSTIPFTPEAVADSKTFNYAVTDLPPEIREQRGAPSLNYKLAFPVSISPDGFNVLGIPLIAGRSFTAEDVTNTIAFEIANAELGVKLGGVSWVAIINQSLAKQLWPGENPTNAVGKIFYDEVDKSHEVVGVVRNYHQWPGNNSLIPTIYGPARGTAIKQQFLVRFRPGVPFEYFRSNVRDRLFSLEPGLVTLEVRPLNELVAETTANHYLAVQLIGCFTLLGIIVSGLCVYATATLAVVSKNREIGIRIAFGSQTRDIIILTLWRGIRAILMGLPFGLLLAFILSKVLSSVLFQVNIVDPLTWIFSCMLLTCITIIAALIPALRAASVNPLDVLRNK